MTQRDYYDILGIGKTADENEVKRAYRSLAMKHHPDRNAGDTQAAEQMKEINEAYAVLSDSQKRRLYDTYGHAGLQGYSQDDIFRNVDFSSLFHDFGLGGNFGDSIFSSFFGGRTATAERTRKGVDLRYDLNVTLEDVAFGAEKTINLTKSNICPECKGTGAAHGGLVSCYQCQGQGQVIHERRSGHAVFRQISACPKCRGRGEIVKERCPQCQGKGSIEQKKDLTVKIPAGADSGQAIKVNGEGESSEERSGDLYIVLNVEKHSFFERHDDDIYLQQSVPFTTAALGGKIYVPGLKDKIQLDIPEGTQTGTVLRKEGAGIPHLNNRGKGDQYIVVKVITPTHLTRQEKDLLRQFEKLRPPEAPQPE